MEKVLKSILIVIGIIVLIGVIIGMTNYFKIQNNTIATVRAVVVDVHENFLGVMGIENVTGLISVGIPDDDQKEYKQGQEILIYFDGMVLSSYPAQLNRIGKIEIIDEKSETAIPDDVLKYYYSSKDKVEVSVNEVTKTGITITIKDSNELPYTYKDNYIIQKKVKNEAYTGVAYPIGENTSNSVAPYMGTGPEYFWKELDKIPGVLAEDTVEQLSYNLPNMDENTKYNVYGKKFNWSQLYGELTEGEYEFLLQSEIYIKIKLTVSADGEITADKPEKI